MIKRFTDLEVWKEAHELTLLIYQVTKAFPKEESYGLTSQIKRASVSIESCVAEGFSRYHFKDRLSSYYDARGSLSEVQSQLLIAKDLNYLNDKDFKNIFAQTEKVGIILNGLIRSTGNLSKK